MDKNHIIYLYIKKDTLTKRNSIRTRIMFSELKTLPKLFLRVRCVYCLRVIHIQLCLTYIIRCARDSP